MKKYAGINFFLYALIATIALGVLLKIYAAVADLEICLLYRNLYIGFIIFFSIGFGLFGNIYASPSYLTISSAKVSISELGNKLDQNKYKLLSKSSDTHIWTSNKFNNWFYGNIRIKKNGDKIKISAAKCIINKYYKEYK